MANRKITKALVLERIAVLFQQAQAAFKSHPERSNRYVHFARTLAMKAQISLPKHLKRKYCKHCYKYLQSGINCRVRTGKGRVIYFCFSCKKYMRFPYTKRLKKSP